MRYFLLALTCVVVLVIAAAASVPFLLKGDFLTQQLQAAVERSTGRKLSLLAAPEVSIYPDVSVSVKGASLSNPQGMFDGTTVSMERLDVKASLWELLSKKAQIQKLKLVRPRVTLVIDKQGRENWQLPQSADAASGTNSGSSIAGDVEVSLAPVEIIDGEISYTDERTGAVFKAQNVYANVQLPLGGQPFKADGSLKWNGDKVHLKAFIKDLARLSKGGSPVDFAVQASLLQASVSGRMQLGNGLALDGKASLRSQDLRKLAKWAGWTMPDGRGLKDFSSEGAVSISGARAELSKAKLQMDGMQANGLVRVVTSGDRPAISASLGVGRLDLNVYTGPAKDAQNSGGDGDAGWSETPIDLSTLGRLDADLRLRAREILYQKLSMGDVSLDAKIKNGALTSTLNSLTLYDAKAKGTLTIDGSQSTPRLAGKLTARGADMAKLLHDFAGMDRLSGRADIDLNLAGVGRSQAEMVSTLDGTAALNVRDGELKGIDIPALVNNVQSAVLNGWDSQGGASTKFTRLSSSFKIKDGIADTNDMVLQGPGMEVNGAGRADILRKRLNFKVAPKLSKEASDALAGLPVAIIIKGPWASPQIYPDIEGILKNPEAAFKALEKLGVDVDGAKDALKKEADKLIKKSVGNQVKKVTKEAEKVIGEQGVKELEKAVGEEGAKKAEELGGKLLKGLFNRE